METIVLSDEEEDAVPRTGLCIHCGQVTKPHACPHGTGKIMKRASKAKCQPVKTQRTSAAAAQAKMHAAEGIAMGDGKRIMRQPTLATHSKHPFGSL